MSDLKDFVIKNGVLTRYKRKTGDVVIPNTVTEISQHAFAESEKISSVAIPDSVTTIVDGAFKKCRGLADENGFVIIRDALHGYYGGEVANIPDGVKRICWGPFTANELVTTVVLPSSITEIGHAAFYYCTKLSEITVPDTIKFVGENAFSGCKSLADENGFLVVNNTLYNYYGNDATATIPNGVTRIGMMAFTNENRGNDFVTSIILPDGVKSIGQNAFQCCKNLAEITIPDSVKEIGEYVLVGCDKLNTIITTDEIFAKLWEQLGTKQKNNIILQAAQKGCVGELLKEKIKASKKKLMEHAIANDDATLADNLFSLFTKIPLDELDGYIQKASLAPQVTAFLLDYKNTTYSTDKQEIYETDKIEKELGLKERTPADWKKIFNYKKADKGIVIAGYKGKEVDVVVPAMIGTAKVVEIEEGAFSPCVEKLAAEIRENRSAIRSVSVPFGLKKIGKYAFYGCKKLESVQIADSVTSIGEEAFRYCISLITVTLPKKIKAINRFLFCDCRNLIEIAIPNGVTSMGNFAFNDCTKLEKIILPGSLAKINKDPSWSNRYAFAGCPNLTIHAPAGSYAEQYAKENNIPFVAE